MDPGRAEAAFALIDEYQGQGIGSALMQHLAAIAREAGIKQLIAEVLPQGRPVLTPIPAPLPLPCRKQHWTNADRICLTWTAPRDGAGQITTTANGSGSPGTQGGWNGE